MSKSIARFACGVGHAVPTLSERPSLTRSSLVCLSPLNESGSDSLAVDVGVTQAVATRGGLERHVQPAALIIEATTAERTPGTNVVTDGSRVDPASGMNQGHGRMPSFFNAWSASRERSPLRLEE
jgi:hypothetical protein